MGYDFTQGPSSQPLTELAIIPSYSPCTGDRQQGVHLEDCALAKAHSLPSSPCPLW